MKLFVLLTLAALQCCAHGTTATAEKKTMFRPLRIRMEDIISEGTASNSALLEELTTVGMVSITDMPGSFRRAKQDTLAWSHVCAMESTLTKEHVFADGTRRRTMATHTMPAGKDQSKRDTKAMEHQGGEAKGSHESSACRSLNEASQEFRHEVDRATMAFAGRVAKLLHGEDTAAPAKPLLRTHNGVEFHTLLDVVDNGEHLEHFHSYQASTTSSSLVESDETKPSASSTIEWHIDQGLFLVFTPGLMVAYGDEVAKGQLLEETEGFYIELQDGTQATVQLDSNDDLVIMMGDGVNQYINPSSSHSQLRAVPHALSMFQPSQDKKNHARVWYGRMVLPPEDAIHPKHGETFGHLRQLLIDASTSTTSIDQKQEVLSLGCSSHSMHARQLEESSCEEGTLLCWHRCMSLQEAGVSQDLCTEQGLDLRCINPRMQLWDNTHGDFFPGCINASSAEINTEYTKLPDYPRDEESCSDDAFLSFVETKAATYDHMANLTEGGVFLWSVEDGDKINGMLAYSGLFGYTAFGFAGPAYPEVNAMLGSIIVMATPSSEYSPVTGFDMALDPVVQEYAIGSTSDKAFRHWMTPVTSTSRGAIVGMMDSYGVEETECFTAMTFSTPGIFDTAFNVSGTDRMIWGANGQDIFAGYHGKSRGVLEIEWSTGKLTILGMEENDTGEKKDHDDHNHEGTEASSGNAFSPYWPAIVFGASLVTLVWP